MKYMCLLLEMKKIRNVIPSTKELSCFQIDCKFLTQNRFGKQQQAHHECDNETFCIAKHGVHVICYSYLRLLRLTLMDKGDPSRSMSKVASVASRIN